MTVHSAGARSAPQRIVELYEHFSRLEAPGRSALYAEVAKLIAGDAEVVAFLAAMPRPKWQPNLLLAAVRYLYGTPASAEEFVELVHAHFDAVGTVMSVRTTQTNEPARCATLLPSLARLPQPLALLEVGASAGLCLLPDRYAYDYGRRRIEPTTTAGTAAASVPVFECRASAATPLPERNVEVAWRAGLDLSPVDLTSERDVRWLEALVWPGQEYRLPRLRAACDIARADPPLVIQGDLRTDLRALARQAPCDATLVVFHTAVLGYVRGPDRRAAFARTVAEANGVWIANENPRFIPGIPDDLLAERAEADDFLLCVDGVPTAWTDGHGTFIDWREGPQPGPDR